MTSPDTEGDKMELAESDEGLSAVEISSAAGVHQCLLEDADLVGIEAARLYPRATEHIPEMIATSTSRSRGGRADEVDGNCLRQ